jgi:hypothetical protein
MPYKFLTPKDPGPSFLKSNEKTLEAVIIKNIIDMMKSAKEDNLDLAMTDEMILEAENILRQGLTSYPYYLWDLTRKRATNPEGSLYHSPTLIKTVLYLFS